MLVHHFGSKEALIAAVMQEIHHRLQSIFDSLAKNVRGKQSADLVLTFWDSVTKAENLEYMRLLFEVQVLAIQNPRRYQRYLLETSSSWLRLIKGALPQSRQRAAMATLSTAVIDGLILELLSTGDKSRASRAIRLFVAQFDGRRPRTCPSAKPARKRARRR
jgi:AcrR family transcriptional regulator